MKRLFCSLLIMGLAATARPATAQAVQSADVELWRLDCGRFDNFNMTPLSDDDRYRGQRRNLANGCYLIRHGSDYLLWDVGLPIGPGGGPAQSIVEQIARIGVRADQIRYLAISHAHPDHIGQAADFPSATLLIGARDWEALQHPPPWLSTRSLAAWMTGGSRVELVSRDPIPSYDKDLFGDGSVVMIATPGHTPGHHSLIVHLRRRVIMLSGDLFHLHESYDHDVVPTENENRADTLASIDRFKRLAVRYHATVIVQHDPGDIDELPAFPMSAR